MAIAEEMEAYLDYSGGERARSESPYRRQRDTSAVAASRHRQVDHNKEGLYHLRYVISTEYQAVTNIVGIIRTIHPSYCPRKTRRGFSHCRQQRLLNERTSTVSHRCVYWFDKHSLFLIACDRLC